MKEAATSWFIASGFIALLGAVGIAATVLTAAIPLSFNDQRRDTSSSSSPKYSGGRREGGEYASMYALFDKRASELIAEDARLRAGPNYADDIILVVRQLKESPYFTLQPKGEYVSRLMKTFYGNIESHLTASLPGSLTPDEFKEYVDGQMRRVKSTWRSYVEGTQSRKTRTSRSRASSP